MLIVLVCFLPACDYLQPRQEVDESKQLLARVDDRFLYKEDIESLFTGNYSMQDSITLLNNYVESWIRNQLAVRAAKQNIPDDIPEIEKQVQDYKESLFIHLYETELVKQKMDTTVSAHEVAEYYENYTDNFKLRNDVVMIRFIKLDEATPNIEQAGEWLRQLNEENKRLLYEYCMQYAVEFTIEDDFWISVQKVKSLLPVTAEDLEVLSRRNVAEQLNDENYTFLIMVDAYRSQGDLAPLVYVEENISKIILNRRKRSLINNTYNNLYQDALKERLFERFDN